MKKDRLEPYLMIARSCTVSNGQARVVAFPVTVCLPLARKRPTPVARLHSILQWHSSSLATLC